VAEAQARHQTQLVLLEHPQVLAPCSKEQTEAQAEEVLELEAQVLRQQVQVVAQAVDCQHRQLLDLQVATVELRLGLG
jgi:hypothetical protein